MPVALVSWDSVNNTIGELNGLVDKFDRVYLELNESANELLNKISETIYCEHAMYIAELSKDSNASQSLESIFKKFSHLKSGNVLIISHQSFFRSAGHIVSEWQPLSLESF